MNVLALCVGGGSLELGLSLVVRNLRTVCLVEGEAFAVALARLAEMAGIEVNHFVDANEMVGINPVNSPK